MDRSLLDAVHNGDPRARQALARWLTAELRTYYQRRSHIAPIEDLIQASATEIFAKLDGAPHDPALFYDWVHERAGMRARAIKRDTQREHARIADSPPHSPAQSASESVLQPIIHEAERQLVLDHAQRLQPIFRTAILHILDGGDYKSLAEREGIPLGTAWERVDRATKLVTRSIAAHRRTRRRYRTPK